jgi:anti-anti-sigma regulatory factor
MSQDQIEAAAAGAPRLADGNGRVPLELSEHGDTAVVRLRGNIDAALTRNLRDSLTWAVNHHTMVLVDLSAACVVDRSALVALARAHRRATALGAVLCLVERTRS